jgi:hypothetical protein
LEQLVVAQEIVDDSACQNDFDNAVNGVNEEMKKIQIRLDLLEPKVNELVFKILGNVAKLTFFTYYYAFYNRGIPQLKPLTFKEVNLGTNKKQYGAIIPNYNIDSISIKDTFLFSTQPINNYYDVIIAALKQLKEIALVSPFSKTLYNNVQALYYDLANIEAIKSLNEFNGKNFGVLTKTYDNFNKDIESVNSDYTIKVTTAIDTAVAAENKIISENITGVILPDTTKVKDLLTKNLSDYESSITTYNKEYITNVNGLIAKFYADLKTQLPFYFTFFDRGVVTDGFEIKVNQPIGGILTNFYIEQNKQPSIFVQDIPELLTQAIELKILSLNDIFGNNVISTHRSNQQFIKFLAYQLAQFNNTEIIKSNFLQDLEKVIADNNEYLDDLMFYANNVEAKYRVETLKLKLGKTLVCGQPLFEESIAPEEQSEDLEKAFFSNDQEGSNFLKIGYWLKFSKVLNVVALQPQHYAVGLTTPDGPKLMPINWIPLTARKFAGSLYVLFITVNGVVVSPALYEFKFSKASNELSQFKILFRGGNSVIKTGTGVEKIAIKIVDGIDVTPEISKKLPFSKDDLPILERLKISNILFLDYLNKWCVAAKRYSGLQ